MTGAAVIIGASGGIGAALEAALIEEATFEKVYGFARSRSGAQHLDLLDETSIAAAAAHVATGPAPTLVIVATGLLHAGERGPEKAMRELDPAWLAETYAINAVGPALVAKHFLPIMPKTGRAVFAALSARVGSISDNKLGGWHGYRASKAALNMLVKTASVEYKRRLKDVMLVCYHPGTVDTGLSKPFQKNVAAKILFTPEFTAKQLIHHLSALNRDQACHFIDWNGEVVTW